MTDTQNPGGWPDASKPGVPQNPERAWWHWLRRAEDGLVLCKHWSADQGGWVDGVTLSPATVVEYGVAYCGPCLTPAEVAAREAAARREGIEAALDACRRREHFHVVDDYDGVNDDLRADGVRGCIAAICALLEDGR